MNIISVLTKLLKNWLTRAQKNPESIIVERGSELIAKGRKAYHEGENSTSIEYITSFITMMVVNYSLHIMYGILPIYMFMIMKNGYLIWSVKNF